MAIMARHESIALLFLQDENMVEAAKATNRVLVIHLAALQGSLPLVEALLVNGFDPLRKERFFQERYSITPGSSHNEAKSGRHRCTSKVVIRGWEFYRSYLQRPGCLRQCSGKLGCIEQVYRRVQLLDGGSIRTMQYLLSLDPKLVEFKWSEGWNLGSFWNSFYNKLLEMSNVLHAAVRTKNYGQDVVDLLLSYPEVKKLVNRADGEMQLPIEFTKNKPGAMVAYI
jgi:hypothetical protein